ncbi:MAG: tRNA pseudouridine(38-40) synthase TruA [Clostridia bacterium]|nr:tRNA pseudouridine(38-40) synthase TruA [Clostridia bacterium]
MKNYKIVIQYEGTRYNGWQRQGNTSNTIQGKFEDVLSKMAGKTVEINASGRTDAGVHARGQVANFKCAVDMTEDEIAEYLNHYLPKDIAVISIEEMPERFHARLNAKSKTYEYVICAKQKSDVFNRRTQYNIDEMPDIELMKEATKLLIGKHDFKGFSSVGRTKKSTVRTINSIDIEEKAGVITIRINGNGFLYNMVRIISGTLLEIGLRKREISCIEHIFESRDRTLAGDTLPAEGLALIEVLY